MRPLQQYYEFMGVSLHCHHLTIQSQGNVRCVVRHDGTLVESNEYYPYGGLFSATASTQPYKYGSKELDRTNGLDLYDSEARWYDSLLGRTTTMDPLAEKYSRHQINIYEFFVYFLSLLSYRDGSIYAVNFISVDYL